LTETQAAQAIKERLETKLLQRASVSVQVREFRARPISVIGAVRQPGNLEFSGRWTLLEALTAAGGIGDNHGRLVYVLRRSDNGLSDQVAINLDDLLVRADPRVNIPIFANDLINVPVAVPVTIYCLGEVQRPGALSFKSSDRVTLLAAIAQAGGMTDRASSRILVKRKVEGSGEREIAADYKRILSGKDPDVDLIEGDVVVVKESFF
jgi:polysaccharide export outer membrane protein